MSSLVPRAFMLAVPLLENVLPKDQGPIATL